MQTELSDALLKTAQGQRANAILRSCVHCGFCNATCPTYQLTGDELDGPRGRIYLIKELLEGEADPQRARNHLDRCLTCRACETTCPSGVAYGELLEIGRSHTEPARGRVDKILRRLLIWSLHRARRFRRLVQFGRMFRWLLPARLAEHLPDGVRAPAVQEHEHSRYVVVLQGCVQQSVTPQVNENLAELLHAHDIGVRVLANEPCCGALPLHLGDEAGAARMMAQLVDELAPHLQDAEAIISTASGCGVNVKDTGRLLASDKQRAADARRVSAKTLDIAEYLHAAALPLQKRDDLQRVAWHAPCTLQHGQKVTGLVENLLTDAGYQLTPVQDAHLCCGSAGTYSVLQPGMSRQLRDNKLANLLRGEPQALVTANIGCHQHLSAGAQAAGVPTLHWTELLR